MRQYVLGKLPRVDGRIGYAPGVETLEDKGCAGLARRMGPEEAPIFARISAFQGGCSPLALASRSEFEIELVRGASRFPKFAEYTCSQCLVI